MADPKRLVKKESKMNAAKYTKILEEILFPFVKELCLWRTFIFKQDNNPNYTVKVAHIWFEDNKVDAL